MRATAALLAGLALALGAAACGDESGVETSAGGEVEGTRVGMRNLRFVPDRVRVAEDATVTFVNDESIQHTVVARSGADFESKLLSQGDTYKVTPHESGTIAYLCTLHPGMRGRIVVR
ncbi:MAG TPA: plastocyanin/azurin family copper-binding protein [Baekduia sp.]|nr:plastocyanin/azurin family copper-binding protein [Baekduia sp.]